jgi:hypothetical protein
VLIDPPTAAVISTGSAGRPDLLDSSTSLSPVAGTVGLRWWSGSKGTWQQHAVIRPSWCGPIADLTPPFQASSQASRGGRGGTKPGSRVKRAAFKGRRTAISREMPVQARMQRQKAGSCIVQAPIVGRSSVIRRICASGNILRR